MNRDHSFQFLKMFNLKIELINISLILIILTSLKIITVKLN